MASVPSSLAKKAVLSSKFDHSIIDSISRSRVFAQQFIRQVTKGSLMITAVCLPQLQPLMRSAAVPTA